MRRVSRCDVQLQSQRGEIYFSLLTALACNTNEGVRAQHCRHALPTHFKFFFFLPILQKAILGETLASMKNCACVRLFGCAACAHVCMYLCVRAHDPNSSTLGGRTCRAHIVSGAPPMQQEEQCAPRQPHHTRVLRRCVEQHLQVTMTPRKIYRCTVVRGDSSLGLQQTVIYKFYLHDCVLTSE